MTETWLGVGAAWLAAISAAIFGGIAAHQSRAARQRAELDAAAARSGADRAERALAETRRIGDHTAEIAQALQPPPPAPAWRVDWLRGTTYVVRNVGNAVAHGVVVEVVAALVHGAPTLPGVTLDPGEATSPIAVTPTSTAGVPASFLVTCDELGPSHVAVPAGSR